jgi:hypothetical protein
MSILGRFVGRMGAATAAQELMLPPDAPGRRLRALRRSPHGRPRRPRARTHRRQPVRDARHRRCRRHALGLAGLYHDGRLRGLLLGVGARRAALSQHRAASAHQHGDLRLAGAPYHGRAVYLSATAAELDGPGLDRGVEIYPGSGARGASRIGLEDVPPPSALRLYRAEVTEAFVLCPREPRQPCPLHGIAADHRTPVVPWRARPLSR